MITESGRFQMNSRICLSISDYHPESWNPVWPVRSIIIGLISFFVTNDTTVGSINVSFQERKRIAERSRTTITSHHIFKQLFVDYTANVGLGSEVPQETLPVSIDPTLLQAEAMRQPLLGLGAPQIAVRIEPEEQ